MYQFKLNDPDFLPHSGCDVEFSLRKGELVLLTGENGIGKTTLVRRFYRNHVSVTSIIEQGSMDFFYDRKIGLIRELLLTSRGGEISHDIFDLSWTTFGLDKKSDRYQSELSGGEGQALKLSLGLPLIKDLFILDEPTQYLDSTMKAKLANLVSHLLHLGKTFIIIEHDVSWVNLPSKVIELGVEKRLLTIRKTWTT